jgi:hypothetical protein
MHDVMMVLTCCFLEFDGLLFLSNDVVILHFYIFQFGCCEILWPFTYQGKQLIFTLYYCLPAVSTTRPLHHVLLLRPPDTARIAGVLGGRTMYQVNDTNQRYSHRRPRCMLSSLCGFCFIFAYYVLDKNPNMLRGSFCALFITLLFHTSLTFSSNELKWLGIYFFPAGHSSSHLTTLMPHNLVSSVLCTNPIALFIELRGDVCAKLDDV